MLLPKLITRALPLALLHRPFSVNKLVHEIKPVAFELKEIHANKYYQLIPVSRAEAAVLLKDGITVVTTKISTDCITEAVVGEETHRRGQGDVYDDNYGPRRSDYDDSTSRRRDDDDDDDDMDGLIETLEDFSNKRSKSVPKSEPFCSDSTSDGNLDDAVFVREIRAEQERISEALRKQAEVFDRLHEEHEKNFSQSNPSSFVESNYGRSGSGWSDNHSSNNWGSSDSGSGGGDCDGDD